VLGDADRGRRRSSAGLGDWVAQSDWQATNKTRSWAALAAHLITYHLVMAALLLLPVLRDGWPAWKALLALLVSAATQALHLAILAMLAVLLG
jgi:hypothetical protein